MQKFYVTLICFIITLCSTQEMHASRKKSTSFKSYIKYPDTLAHNPNNIITRSNETIMHVAALEQNNDMVSELINLGALALRDNYGENPLHKAVRGAHENKPVVCETIIRAFPDLLSARNQANQTPYELALVLGKKELAKHLVSIKNP